MSLCGHKFYIFLLSFALFNFFFLYYDCKSANTEGTYVGCLCSLQLFRFFTSFLIRSVGDLATLYLCFFFYHALLFLFSFLLFYCFYHAVLSEKLVVAVFMVDRHSFSSFSFSCQSCGLVALSTIVNCFYVVVFYLAFDKLLLLAGD